VDATFIEFMELTLQALNVGVTCMRNSAEVSITRKRLRPDCMLLAGDTLMFKGEDKVGPQAEFVALRELQSKMSKWSANYHGKVFSRSRDRVTAAMLGMPEACHGLRNMFCLFSG